ncbi:hypothetical protein K440DRAFT_628023 [Wilcoxina mikolae CBS 423.85]|nr:hypothetical protein K440DRAFT_628023 [Wilcoxina mikolae CBS 423.85]
MPILILLLLASSPAFAQLPSPSTSSSSPSPSASPSSLSIPACAQKCVTDIIPAFNSDLEKACSEWKDSAIVNGSTGNLQSELRGCVFNNCTSTNTPEDSQKFNTAVAAACADSTTVTVISATPSATAETQVGQKGQKGQTLSIGAIAGIVVGILAIVFLLMLAIFLCIRRRNNNRHHYRDEALESNRPSVWVSPPTHNIEPSPPGSRDGNIVSPVSPALAAEKHLGGHGGEALAPPPWSPVSPITHGQLNRQTSVVSALSLNSHGDVTPPPQPSPTKRASIARADSVSWRREVEEAAGRAARRVSAMASAPMLEAQEGERRSSSGSRPASLGKRWSRK